MFWQPSEILDIVINQVRRPVVMAIDGGDFVAQLVVCLADSDVEREDGMYDGEDQQVPVSLEKAPYSESLFIFHCSFVGLLGGVQRGRRQIRLSKGLASSSPRHDASAALVP